MYPIKRVRIFENTYKSGGKCHLLVSTTWKQIKTLGPKTHKKEQKFYDTFALANYYSRPLCSQPTKSNFIEVLGVGVCVVKLVALYNGAQHGLMNYTR